MLEKLVDILSEYTEMEKDRIDMSTDLVADLGLNSLDMVGLVVKAEEIFHISIPDKDIWKFRTVGDVLDYIREETEEEETWQMTIH